MNDDLTTAVSDFLAHKRALGPQIPDRGGDAAPAAWRSPASTA